MVRYIEEHKDRFGVEPCISASAGVDVPVVSERDPYQLFRELMVVVEELCPTWPARDTFEKHRIFLL